MFGDRNPCSEISLDDAIRAEVEKREQQAIKLAYAIQFGAPLLYLITSSVLGYSVYHDPKASWWQWITPAIHLAFAVSFFVFGYKLRRRMIARRTLRRLRGSI